LVVLLVVRHDMLTRVSVTKMIVGWYVASRYDLGGRYVGMD